MTAKKFNTKQTEYIVAQYKRGRSSRCLAREMGVTPQTILIYLKAENVERRVAGAKKVIDAELAQLAMEMRKKDIPWKKIETKIGVSKETLRVAVLKLKAGEPI